MCKPRFLLLLTRWRFGFADRLKKPDHPCRINAVDRKVHLSQEELLALLYLPFFRTPNQLSPFYDLQIQGVALENDPKPGLESLAAQGLWNLKSQELSRDGQLLFIPVFSPTARIMLFQGARESIPFQEFYAYRRYLSFFSDKGGVSISGTISDQDMTEHLRKIFPDRRPPISNNKISLFEDEFVTILLMVALTQEEGMEQVTSDALMEAFLRRMRSEEGLALPILGRYAGDFAEQLLEAPQILLDSAAALARDRLLEESAPGIFSLAPYTKVVFFKLAETREIFLLREELIDGDLLVREVSIFNGHHGYFLGRHAYLPQQGRRVVYLEDLEWHELFRILNEIARPSDYTDRLSLEVLRRHQSVTRG